MTNKCLFLFITIVMIYEIFIFVDKYFKLKIQYKE